jgi:hypothetical protein
MCVGAEQLVQLYASTDRCTSTPQVNCRPSACCMRTGVHAHAHIIRRSPVRGWLGPVYDALYGLYNHSRQTRSDQAVRSISACRISKKFRSCMRSWTVHTLLLVVLDDLLSCPLSAGGYSYE